MDVALVAPVGRLLGALPFGPFVIVLIGVGLVPIRPLREEPVPD